MTLDGQLTCTYNNKMAVSASTRPGTTSGLSFSISRLLEKSTDSETHVAVDPAPLDTKPETAKATGMLLDRDQSPPESPLEVDDDPADLESEDGHDNEEDDEDVKVNDSGDEESAGSRPDDSKLADYSSHPPHSSIGIDWYALYALQQQQQHQHHHQQHLPPGMIPAHLMQHNSAASGFSGHRGGPSGMLNLSAGAYLSYPSTPGSTPNPSLNGTTPSGPPGFPPPLGLSSSSQHSPLSPASLHHHHMSNGGLNPAGIPNAFAALLEATVFKDRLAAGKRISNENVHFTQSPDQS